MSRNVKRRKGGPTEEAAAKRIKPVDLAVEHIDSDDEDDSENDHDATSSSEDEHEDLATKKVRLAKEYLQRIQKEESESDGSDNDDEEEEDEDDRTGRRLQRQRLKREGTFEQNIADKLSKQVNKLAESIPMADTVLSTDAARAWVEAGRVQLLRGHDLTPTCVALLGDGTRAISGAKDHSVILWDIENATKLSTVCPHWKKSDGSKGRTAGQVLSVACSDDGRYAAVGSRNALVRIFDLRTSSLSCVQEFRGHKAAVTSLAFRKNSLQLFSASEDRCIRHYNLQEMMYMETLYGHQFGVTAIDCHHKERPVSVGRDRTARAWKLAEDTHLIYRGGSRVQNAESVSLIKDDWFLTGHEDGNLSLWYTEKKKAVAVQTAAHGTNAGGLGRGVVSVHALRGSDLCATGSYDGFLRLWKVRTGVTASDRGLEPLAIATPIPLEGYLNSIAIGPNARFAVVAKGQEHRLGRWNPLKRVKNRLAIVQLYATSDDANSGNNDDDEQADGANHAQSDDETVSSSSEEDSEEE